ncbi:MAG: DUF1592 domain-containing protein [Pirellulaceae bacterium]
MRFRLTDCMSNTATIAHLFAWLFLVVLSKVGHSEDFRQALQPLIDSSCIHCHDSDTDTGLNFESLGGDFTDADTFKHWENVFDRVESGEMPPKSEERPATTIIEPALLSLRKTLVSESRRQQAERGRVPARRLTKLEFGFTLQDLLQIQGDVTSGIPDETESGSFDTVGSTQRLSALHMESYLKAADDALELAIRLEANPQKKSKANYAWLRDWHTKPINLGGSVTRPHESGEGIVLFRDADYLTGFQFQNLNPYGGAGAVGIHRLKAKVEAYQSDEVLTAKIIVKSAEGSSRLVLAEDLEPGKPQTIYVETYLQPGDRPYLTFTEPRGGSQIFQAGGAENFNGPGLAILSQEVEGPLVKTWPPASTQDLLAGIELKSQTSIIGSIGSLIGGSNAATFSLEATRPAMKHVAEIVESFALRAFRSPSSANELDAYIRLARPAIEAERPLEDALRIPLRAILTAPRFIMLAGDPGELDDFALASRLSYFLWKSLPDEQLLELATEGELKTPDVLRSQVDRMLEDPKARRFVDDFVGQWLRVHKVNATSPDDGLYPEFDEVLAAAIPQETQLYFAELLNENMGVSYLIDSNFTMVNRRLAEHYGIDGVKGQDFQRVELPADSPRGGLLTQAAILKTTANGTNTSPVMRGNFVLTNFLGTPPSPPPPNVGSIEPDTRGATTIRELLAAHRELDTCNTCHQEIDPPGFALESFDPVGGYREHYRLSGGKTEFQGFSVNLPPKQGPAVDPSGVTAAGDDFSDVSEFKQLLFQKKEQIAKNFIEKLVVYATGGEIQFADREAINSILDQTRSDDFPVKDILHAIVQSPLFREK